MNHLNRWHFDKQVNLSVLVQLVLLAGLILGSWVNLQRQLDLLGRDVKQLLTAQEKFCGKIEQLGEKSISYEYRLRAAEERIENEELRIKK